MNAIVAQIKNCPISVNTTTELKTITTINNNNNKIKVNILKVILQYFNGVLVVNIFVCSFVKHISDLCHCCVQED
jgi:hypothetical protein